MNYGPIESVEGGRAGARKKIRSHFDLFRGLKRSLIILLLLLSPLFLLLNSQTSIGAVPVMSTFTFTHTSTWYGISAYGPTTATITGQNETYVYQSNTTIWVTYTTTVIVAVPIIVQTVVVYPVTAVRGQVYYVTQTTWIQIIGPSTIKGTVTSQTVKYSTATTTPTKTATITWTPAAVDFTTTGTYTYTMTFTSNTSELANPNPPPLQLPFDAWWLWGTANLPIVLAVFAVGVAVLGFTLGRRGRGQQRAPQQPATSRVFCGKCGTANPASFEFCESCGNKLESS